MMKYIVVASYRVSGGSYAVKVFRDKKAAFQYAAQLERPPGIGIWGGISCTVYEAQEAQR